VAVETGLKVFFDGSCVQGVFGGTCKGVVMASPMFINDFPYWGYGVLLGNAKGT